MNAVDLLVLGLAINQAVETWHHGSIFSERRAYFESRGGLLGQLMTCMFCLSHWVAMFVIGWWAWSFFQYGDREVTLLTARVPIYWLAVTRVSQLVNDLTRPWSRTPRPEFDLLDDWTDDEDSAGA